MMIGSVEDSASRLHDDERTVHHAAAPGPFIRVVRGGPTDDDIAAIVAVLAAASSTIGQPAPHISVDGWGSPVQLLRYGLLSAPTHFVNARYSR